MAQHDYVIANGTGAAVRSDLNNALAAIVSQNSGATTPSTTYAYQWWADTTTGLLKLRNAANSAWITLFQLDGEWSTIALENGTAAAPSIYFKDSGTDTGFYSPGTDQVGISTGGTARLTIDSNGNVNIDSNTLYVDAANNRVGLGTSSPNYELHINASDSTNFIQLTNSGTGTGASDGFLIYNNGVNATVSNQEAGYLSLETSGQARLHILSDGKVGIGTSDPGSFNAVLAVQKSQTADTAIVIDNSGTVGASTTSSFIVADGGGTKGWFRRYRDGSGNNGIGFTDALLFEGNIGGTKATRMVIDSSGRVGIGTTTPSQALQIVTAGEPLKLQSTTAGNNYIIHAHNSSGNIGLLGAGGGGAISSGASTDYAICAAQGSLLFASNGNNERARIDSSGRLLVGTSSDVSGGEAAALIQSVYSTGALTSIGRDDTTVNNNDFIGGIDFHTKTGASSTWQRSARILCFADADQGSGDAPGRLTFSTTADGASNPTERMRITSSGAILVGTTDADSATRLRIVDGSAGTTSKWVTAGTSTKYLLEFFNDNGSVGRISVNGSATTFSTSSDYRLKENVVPLTGAIDRVNQLQVHRFNFIADPDTTVDGFIAHEAQAVVPECVTGTKDEVDADGNPVYQGIDQSKLVPLLTAALQEAMERIEQLETEMAAVKAQLS